MNSFLSFVLKIHIAQPLDCKSKNIIIDITCIKLDMLQKLSLLLQSVEYKVFPGRCYTPSIVGHYVYRQQQVPIYNKTFLKFE